MRLKLLCIDNKGTENFFIPLIIGNTYHGKLVPYGSQKRYQIENHSRYLYHLERFKIMRDLSKNIKVI